MKTLIERNLKFNNQYTVTNISITGIETDWCSCDNCGRSIANRATVQQRLGDSFTIGLDCLKTLTQAGCILKGTYLQSQDEISDAIKVGAFVGFCQGADIKKDWLHITATKNGKTKTEYNTSVQRYAPQFYARLG